MKDREVKVLVSEGDQKDEEEFEVPPYSEEDFELLTKTFGKGVNKRKMLVTKGITLKDLFNMGGE